MATSAGSAAVAAASARSADSTQAQNANAQQQQQQSTVQSSPPAAASSTASSGSAPGSSMNSPAPSASPAPPTLGAASPPSPMQPNMNRHSSSGGSSNELQLPAAAAQPASLDATSPQPLFTAARKPPGSARSAPREELMSPTSSSSGGGAPANAAHRRAMTTATGAPQNGAPEAWMEWPPPSSVRGASGSSTLSGSGSASFPPASSVSPSSASPLLHADLPPSQSLYMQGILTKKGRNLGFGLGFWRTTRLYMLTDTTFSFTDKSKKSVKGEHAVETFKSVTRMTSRRWPNRCFTLVFEDHQLYHLRAPTTTECTDWIDSLSKAIQNCEKTKARWRFMRDNQQMQQMAQMQQGGMPYGSMLSPSPQQQLEMNQMGFSSSPNAALLGLPMQPMMQPMMNPMQMPMHPMLAMQMGMGLPGVLPPMHPMAMNYPPLQGYPESMPGEAQGNGPAPMLQNRLKSRSRTSLPGVGLGLARNDSRGSSRSKGLGATAGATGGASSGGGGGGASSSEQDPHTDDDPEDEEAAGLSDDQFVSGEDPDREDEGDEFYDDEDEIVPTYYRAASQPSYPYAPSAAAAAQAAAAYAVAQQQAQAQASASAWASSQQALLLDASLFPPSDQSVLNSQKERLVWMSMFFALVGCVILGMGYEGRTTRQIGEMIVGVWKTAPSVAVAAVGSVVAGIATNATAVGTAAATIAAPSSSFFSTLLSPFASLFALRWSMLILLLSGSGAGYCAVALKKLKRAAKKRRQAEAEAKKKAQALSKSGAPGAPAISSAQQALVWKEQSKVLAKELAQTTRLMLGLGVSAASFVACAAIMYRA